MIKGLIGVAIDRPVAHESNLMWKTHQSRGNLNSATLTMLSTAIAELSRRATSLWARGETRWCGSSLNSEDRGIVRTCGKPQLQGWSSDLYCRGPARGCAF